MVTDNGISVRLLVAWLIKVREKHDHVFRGKPSRALILVCWFPAALVQEEKQYKQTAAPVGIGWKTWRSFQELHQFLEKDNEAWLSFVLDFLQWEKRQ